MKRFFVKDKNDTKTNCEEEMSEAEIDRNLKDTFPASDPPSWTLGTNHKENPGCDPDEQKPKSQESHDPKVENE
jgi:hypothetical protein